MYRAQQSMERPLIFAFAVACTVCAYGLLRILRSDTMTQLMDWILSYDGHCGDALKTVILAPLLFAAGKTIVSVSLVRQFIGMTPNEYVSV
jgi:hypothetical protein